mmetsp:Transcript_33038/g.72456  ORF Transcript_33038/g.72456 Transcript_33038/m.72456 type:complete len:200 (-) Transcript_33038:134-733(-)
MYGKGTLILILLAVAPIGPIASDTFELLLIVFPIFLRRQSFPLFDVLCNGQSSGDHPAIFPGNRKQICLAVLLLGNGITNHLPGDVGNDIFMAGVTRKLPLETQLGTDPGGGLEFAVNSKVDHGSSLTIIVLEEIPVTVFGVVLDDDGLQISSIHILLNTGGGAVFCQTFDAIGCPLVFLAEAGLEQSAVHPQQENVAP